MASAAEHESTYEGNNPDDACGTGLVYVMSNQDTGNAVTVFDRSADGALIRLDTYPTGGLGAGSVSNPLDSLVSQGSLILSDDHRFLFAVDAGSNEISVLAVEGEKLVPVDRVPSGGVRPNSVTVYKRLLYVLNSTDGTITGFTVNAHGKLSAVAGSTQTLIGGAAAGHGQVDFTPDGTQLVVTEINNNVIDVLPVDHEGRAGSPVRNDSSGPAPFGFTFAGKDLLIVSEASGSTSSYHVADDGILKVVSGSVTTNQVAACWVVTNSTADPRYAYVSNAGSGSVSGYDIDCNGALSLLDPDGRTGVTTDSRAPIDSIASGDGRFLYVITGGADDITITAFRIETDGGLTTIPGPGELLPLGTQGIAAT